MAKAATKKELVTKSENAIVASAALDYGTEAGAGFEKVRSEDLSLPFISILQTNSPLVEQCEDGSIISGMFLNSVTAEVSNGKDGFVFCPVHRDTAFAEWIPRNVNGGGFVGLHDPQGELVQGIIAKNGGSRIPPKGDDGKRIQFKVGENELIETFYVYGYIMNDEGTETQSFAVISFVSTKIKPYKDWISAMIQLKGKPPIYANRAHIKTVKQTNDSGTYANFQITALKDTWLASLIHPQHEADLLAETKNFKEMVESGMARADFASQTVETGGPVIDGSAGGAAHEGDIDTPAPF